ncbi:MAG: hypothetical protein IJX54_01935 [Oscillospiraceae bacterium]|nr:hypothetical protein [Oscillospiraceae bacterium]
MGPITKLYHLQNMSMADISAMMSSSEFKNYIELHHRTKRVMPENIAKTENEDEANDKI